MKCHLPGNHGDTTAHQVDTTAHQGDTTAHQVDTTAHQVDTTAHQVDTTVHQVDTTAHQVDTTAHQVDTTAHQVDTTAHQVDTTAHQGGTKYGIIPVYTTPFKFLLDVKVFTFKINNYQFKVVIVCDFVNLHIEEISTHCAVIKHLSIKHNPITI